MRTPLGIGLVVGLLILLTLAALVHLVFSPRRTRRWIWLFVVTLVPVVGPLLYLFFGRRGDDEDWDDLAASRSYAPAYVPVAYDDQPARETLDAPAVSPFQDDIDAPSLPETPFRHEHAAVGDMPVEELAYDTPAWEDDVNALPDYTVRDEGPVSDDVPASADYGGRGAADDTADEAQDAVEATTESAVAPPDATRPHPFDEAFLADLSHVEEVPGEERVEGSDDDAGTVAPLAGVPGADAPEGTAAPEASPDLTAPAPPKASPHTGPANHLRARRRKPR